MGKRLGVIGFGAIGRSIVNSLRQTPLPGMEVVAVLMRPDQVIAHRSLIQTGVLSTSEFDDFMGTRPDIVIEAAGHAAVVDYAATILLHGCELFVLSVGALAQDEVSARLIKRAALGHGSIIIPSGALAGFDGLLALRVAGLRSVTYRSIKPVEAWRGTAAEQYCDLDGIQGSVVFFKGTAREAAMRFPKNANLAVAVALAGMGLDHTLTELVADARSETNVGELTAVAERSTLELRLTNDGFEDNPKSSQITGLSVIAALANRSANIRYA